MWQKRWGVKCREALKPSRHVAELSAILLAWGDVGTMVQHSGEGLGARVFLLLLALRMKPNDSEGDNDSSANGDKAISVSVSFCLGKKVSCTNVKKCTA